MNNKMKIGLLLLVLALVSTGTASAACDGIDFGVSSTTDTCIFSNGDIYGVSNGPTELTTFTITESYHITSITNYHWNGGYGAPDGTITLKDSNGIIIGTWNTINSRFIPAVYGVYWDATPNIDLGPGTYTIDDSDPSTWSYTIYSGNQGFSIVKGYPITTPPEPVLTTITVLPATSSVTVGYTTTFTATPMDQFGIGISATVTWSSSNPTVGTIDDSGIFTAISSGETTIAATSGSVNSNTVLTTVVAPTCSKECHEDEDDDKEDVGDNHKDDNENNHQHHDGNVKDNDKDKDKKNNKKENKGKK